MLKKGHLYWLLVIVGSAAAVSVPFFFYKMHFGQWVPRVLIQLETDSLYYLTHIKQLLAGHTLGNPYFLEHRDAFFPGLMLPVYLASIMGIFGAHIHTIYVANTFLFGILTGCIFYALALKLTNGRHAVSAVTTILGVASLANMILRPVIMQTVYPVYGLFALALLSVLRAPESKKCHLFLALTLIISFYLYPYLWMVNFTSVGLLLLYRIWKRNKGPLITLISTCILVGVACIPQIQTIMTLFSTNMGLEIASRTELVNTHLVLPITILNNKYTLLLIMGLIALRQRRHFSSGEALLFLMASAVIIAATSNVITGKEMDFDTHLHRMGLVVNIIAIAVLYASAKERTFKGEKWICGFLFAAVFLTTFSRAFVRMNAYPYILNSKRPLELHEHYKGYESVFTFFNNRQIRDSVILSEWQLGFYLPLYTENTVLYMARAALHVVSNDELLERLLVYRVDDIDEEFLRNNVESFAGGGILHEVIYRNAYARKKNKVEPIDLAGGESFLKSALRKHKQIDRSYEKYLRKYNVNYIVRDSEAEWNPRVPASASKIHEDTRFVIYELN